MTASALMIAILLLGCHMLFDLVLQGLYLAERKNPTLDREEDFPWWYAMFAHSAIHGAAVAAVTQMPALFFAELAAHFVTDTTKCRNKISFMTDQAIHLLCKCVWVWIWIYWN